MTIYSLDILLFLFGTSLFFHVQFQLLLPDLHTGFSRGRSGGLVFPSLSEFSTVYCDPHSQRLCHKVSCCCCKVMSVVSNSVWPHRWQPTRLPRPWDSPGKNTGVSCHFLLQCMKVKSESEVAQSHPTLSNPMDCSLPGSFIHGILQTRVLQLVAIVFSIKCHSNNQFM